MANVEKAALPPGWAWAKLGKLGTWTGGGTPSTKNTSFWTGGIIPWVSPKDMKLDRVGAKADRITKAAVRASATKIVPRHSILCVIRSGILQHTFPVALSECRVSLNQDMRALTTLPGIAPEYVQLYLRLQNNRILHECSKDGTTVASINIDQLKDVDIPVAPYAEQLRIVEATRQVLSDVTEAEAAMRRARGQMADYRASLLHAASTGALTAEWRAANLHPAEDGPALLRRILVERRAAWERAELARLVAAGKLPRGEGWKAIYPEPRIPLGADQLIMPEGWAVATLDQLLGEPPRNGISVKGRSEPPGTPALRLDALGDDKIHYDRCRYIDITARQATALTVRKGDLLVSRANGSKRLVGRASLVADPPAEMVFPDTIIRCRLMLPELGRWIAMNWANATTRGQLERSAKTSAGIWKLGQDDLTSVLIPLPPLSEIDVALAQIAVGSIPPGEITQGETNDLRQSILYAAFAGRLVPQDPAEEPAAALLARIRTEAAPSAPRRRAAPAKAPRP